MDRYFSSAFAVLLSTQMFRLQARFTQPLIYNHILCNFSTIYITSIVSLELMAQWTYQACPWAVRGNKNTHQEV